MSDYHQRRESETLHWQVTLTSGGVHASTDIDLDSLRHSTEPIGDFFRKLAADSRGWEGEHLWSDGGPLSPSATHDGLGHIALRVYIATNVYREPDWEASATVGLEAERLEQIARDAAQLPSLYIAHPEGR